MWANSGRQWRTEGPGVLQSMGSQRVGLSGWTATRLTWKTCPWVGQKNSFKWPNTFWNSKPSYSFSLKKSGSCPPFFHEKKKTKERTQMCSVVAFLSLFPWESWTCWDGGHEIYLLGYRVVCSAKRPVSHWNIVFPMLCSRRPWRNWIDASPDTGRWGSELTSCTRKRQQFWAGKVSFLVIGSCVTSLGDHGEMSVLSEEEESWRCCHFPRSLSSVNDPWETNVSGSCLLMALITKTINNMHWCQLGTQLGRTRGMLTGIRCCSLKELLTF